MPPCRGRAREPQSPWNQQLTVRAIPAVTVLRSSGAYGEAYTVSEKAAGARTMRYCSPPTESRIFASPGTAAGSGDWGPHPRLIKPPLRDSPLACRISHDRSAIEGGQSPKGAAIPEQLILEPKRVDRWPLVATIGGHNNVVSALLDIEIAYWFRIAVALLLARQGNASRRLRVRLGQRVNNSDAD